MAAFLIVEGATGSVLAFEDDIERLVAPQLYATPKPGAARLDVATLAEKVSEHEPKARLAYFFAYEKQILANCAPRDDPATGPYELGFNQMFLDPWTGAELGRRKFGDLSQGMVNFIPFIYELHMSLALGEWGHWTLGVVALLWTLDSFYAFYLTMPTTPAAFWRRWELAWLVKWRAGAFRLNFDLHRAGGLWLWPLLIVFGWSSVMFNMSSVYQPTMRLLFDYEDFGKVLAPLFQRAKATPRLDWRGAQAVGEKLVAEQAQKRGFKLGAPGMFGYMPEVGAFTYGVQSSLDVQRRAWNTGVWFDGDTGELIHAFAPSGEHAGNTMECWLRALHFADVFGLRSYRILVCALGLVIVMLSVTGVYIWWKKRRARKLRVKSGARRGLVEAEIASERSSFPNFNSLNRRRPT